MPSFDYTGLYETADRLITQFGGSGTRTRKTFTVADTTQPWERTSADSTATLTMVTVPWSKEDTGHLFAEDIIAQAQKAIILADSTLEVDDTITYQGVDYRLKAFKLVKPADLALIYVCALAGEA